MELNFQTINKYFDDFHVLKDISFQVHSGQVFGFLGRNGAGKTTTLRILMDVFKANSGEIYADGKKFTVADYQIGYLPEERGMYSKSTVYDQLVYFSMLRQASKAEADQTVRYWAKRFQIEEYLNRKMETLSKGNQQKVQITQAFLNDPDILILDEPFSGLDPVNSDVFKQAIQEFVNQHKIIIFSSHQMPYVEELCDDIAIIEHGEIVLTGSLAEIKKERGLNKVAVQLAAPTDDLRLKLIEQGYQVEVIAGVWRISLAPEKNKHDLLSYLLQAEADIQTFMDYTPSLQEIFVQTVGGNDE